ncbi:branched-chain amino acid transport system permease protein/urea transport system permease protein [Allocatelliglobosispora scoriae]|uniref:Branched-chain amino acid transport system permease protein/urea transport system permease protein n=1 Tax=Allocatelliglobosispora scoriae TaxID=643052 RepID=A0A841BZB8_9ACTN|nr:branched-chain amino acid ABC transporter permease [Allocatelliglobosispora scoriae]MBB5874497.1 branched-chain amino acid transport system permease protein/urea transport system permease protein [Allocatelliglobosispora scoriae]
MGDALVDVLNALHLIGLLVVVALGLGITLGVMGVISLAHLAFIAIGAYTTYAVMEAGGSFWLALLAAPAAGMAIGVATERSVIRFLYQRPLDTVLATWGVGLILLQTLELVFGSRSKPVDAPLSGQIRLLGTSYPQYRAFTIVAAVAVSALALWWLYRTTFGLQIRAIISDREIAPAIGINTARVNTLAFGIGSAFAAFAGVLLAGQTNVTPWIGLPYLVPALLVVLIGGQGSIPGLLAAAAILGVSQQFFTEALTPVTANAIVLALAVVLARLRPAGLLGSAR